uniref:Glucan endo-1,3-beta-D-glucosidase n=1 Tax=Nelumbo nucifera TaxID=4432 RepID=A0A822ZDF3_NELNU|nr:TPA_asm: hypothetical protein HUJ06_000770 [Nelumbo nucifera]
MGAGTQAIGVCYGMSGNNLPHPDEVIDLYKRNNIQKMRLYAPNESVLEALKDSSIELMLGVPNHELQVVAKDQNNASKWVKRYIVRYKDSIKFKFVVVGNQVSRTHPNDFKYILPAMRNMYIAVQTAGFHDQIKVSTAVYSGDLTDTYPPSSSIFKPQVLSAGMREIIFFLVQTRAPLLANVYPFFAYLHNQRDIKPEYAFTCQSVNQVDYQNLFDAMVDSFYYALEKVGGRSLDVVVSETGWPNSGDSISTSENARKYYKKPHRTCEVWKRHSKKASKAHRNIPICNVR